MGEAKPIAHGTLADCAVAAWREGRFDTFTIAKRLGVSEHRVCRAIAADQDARHRARTMSKHELKSRTKILQRAGFEP